jgi:hypothetical protein
MLSSLEPGCRTGSPATRGLTSAVAVKRRSKEGAPLTDYGQNLWDTMLPSPSCQGSFILRFTARLRSKPGKVPPPISRSLTSARA